MTEKKLDEATRREISSTTILHYNERAEAFWEGTRDHDVHQNREALLRHIEGDAPFRVLDFGCGPGRDLKVFRDLGHTPMGLDGSERFCEMARAHSGCEVLHQDFLALDLPPGYFHGVFANASLFHVPTDCLVDVLDHLWTSLIDGGVLFASNPRGENVEGWQGQRYGAYHDFEQWRAFVTTQSFELLEHYYRPPGQPRHLQPWLATVFRKVVPDSNAG